MLGVCYATGSGIKKNDKEAFRWMHLSAKQGHAEAQFRLAGFYAQGVGVEQDLDSAMEYMTLSAKQGYPQAVKALNNVNGILEPFKK